MIKMSNKLRTEGNFLNPIKGIYGKIRTNIILNGEELNAFPLKSGTRQEHRLLPLLFNVVMEVLPGTGGKKRKGGRSSRLERK